MPGPKNIVENSQATTACLRQLGPKEQLAGSPPSSPRRAAKLIQ